jgi:cobalt/nickel transport system permease protein
MGSRPAAGPGHEGPALDLRLEPRAADLGGPLCRFDPRVKVVTVLALIVIVVSFPSAAWRSLALSLAVLAAVAAACRVPAQEILRRVALASPFILMAAVMFPLSQTGAASRWLAPELWARALAIALKAYASVLALSLLVLTERFGRLMGAIRSLGFPAALGSAMAVAGSFLGILGAEAARMKRARESRTPGRLRASKVGTVGRAAALILLRGWDRSKRVQAAMESRGFTGSLPDLDPYRLRGRDVLAAAALLAPFVAVRVILP